MTLSGPARSWPICRLWGLNVKFFAAGVAGELNLPNSRNNLPMASTHPTKLGEICRICGHPQLLSPIPSGIPFFRNHSDRVDCASTFRNTRPCVRTLHRPVDLFFAKRMAKHPNKPTKLGTNCRTLPQLRAKQKNRAPRRRVLLEVHGQNCCPSPDFRDAGFPNSTRFDARVFPRRR